MSDQKPIMLYDGDLCLATSDGALSSITLKSHIHSPTVEPKDQLKVLIKLRKYFDAWEMCKLIDSPDNWNELGMAAVADLNITFGKCEMKCVASGYQLNCSLVAAIKVFRYIGNAAIVFALKSIAYVEDLNYVSGFCALLLNKTDEAKIFFTKSANPLEALHLCRDLLQWEQALSLAESLAPQQIPLIAREYAQQLEFT